MKAGGLERIANEALCIVIPHFSSLYNLELETPEIIMPRWRSRTTDGYFDAIGKAGKIRLNKKACREKGGCARLVSHEMGHSATWQHNRWYFNVPKTTDISYNIYRCLLEGIAMEFEKAGLRVLLETGWMCRKEFGTAMASTMKVCTAGNDEYSIGYSIVSYLSAGASMRGIMLFPEIYFDDILKEYAEMISCTGKKPRKRQGG